MDCFAYARNDDTKSLARVKIYCGIKFFYDKATVKKLPKFFACDKMSVISMKSKQQKIFFEGETKQ